MTNFTRRDFIKTTAIGAIAFTNIAATVTLQWNPVTEADGYRIYWGPISGSYTGIGTIVSGTTARLDMDPPNKVMQIVTVQEDTVIPSPFDVINSTIGSLTLDPGTYYFAVKAYNNYGDSGYSEEVGPTTIVSQSVDHIQDIHMVVPPPPGGTDTTQFILKLHYKA